MTGLNKTGLPKADTGSPTRIICSWLEGKNLTGKSLGIFFFVSSMSETGQDRSPGSLSLPVAALYEPHLAD